MEVPPFQFPSLQEIVSRFLFFQVKQAKMFVRAAKELPFELIEKILEVERRKFVQVSVSYDQKEWEHFETTKPVDLSKISLMKLLPSRKEYVKDSPDFSFSFEISSLPKSKYFSFSLNNSTPSFPIVRRFNDIQSENMCPPSKEITNFVFPISRFMRTNSILTNRIFSDFEDKPKKIGCCENCFRF
nr:hypothetical protein pmam_333 [Pithovirus mammoth]